MFYGFWLLPVLTALAVYSAAFNNFFSYDDFIWLDRSSRFDSWLEIFRPDVFYFDPLVHLVFRANYLLGGVDPRWYHGLDMVIHAVNSLLAYRFVYLLGEDERAALYASLLFASSPAIADAVIWSSSRVDLLMTLCTLGTLIQFSHYLRSENRRHLFCSFLLFILALGSKGTPLLLPLVLFGLMLHYRKPLRTAFCLLPFVALAFIYWTLLHLTHHLAALPLDRLHFNPANVAVALCALFIPEAYLSQLNLQLIAPLLFLAVTVVGLSKTLLPGTAMLRRTGYFILVAAILPFLIITDFKLVSGSSPHYQLLSSPSHRLYLAAAGAAIILGAMLRSCENICTVRWPRLAGAALVLLLVGVLAGNAILVRERNKLWAAVGAGNRCSFEGLCTYRGQVGDGSKVGLINFTGSRGFVTPMLKLSLGINDFVVMPSVTIGMVDDPRLLDGVEKYFVFVLGSDGHVYDISRLFRRQLTTNLLALKHPENREYLARCMEVKRQLATEIGNLLQKPLLNDIYGT